jgi:cytochrome c551/c552
MVEQLQSDKAQQQNSGCDRAEHNCKLQTIGPSLRNIAGVILSPKEVAETIFLSYCPDKPPWVGQLENIVKG